jgi:murein DD-endopeptidase MepM/ murein hydrolase activator NlpD
MDPSAEDPAMQRPRATPAGLLAILLLVLGCEPLEKVRDSFRDLTPHEAYLAALAEAGLAQTALVRDWIAVSREAVAEAPLVQLPFQEEGFIAPDEAVAMAYRLRIGRGQRLSGEVDLASGKETRVFVDLFRVPEEAADPLRPVLAMDSVPGTFRYEPWREGEYILRVQPELLRGGSYRVVLRLEAQLAFPVEGRDEGAILSTFGSPRDAGRRTHHGVDIFAPRGTPVLAAAPGVVSRVQITDLGGKVVWVRDPARNANLYFAHLDSQAVLPGERIGVGDTLGFVGNTGNARATSPHLHFGLYRRGEGPVDPAPFLRRPRGTMEELTADLGRLGTWVKVKGDDTNLRRTPGLRSDVLAQLDPEVPLRIWGGSGSWYRVKAPDGGVGYVAARLTEPAGRPPETITTRSVGIVTAAGGGASPPQP